MLDPVERRLLDPVERVKKRYQQKMPIHFERSSCLGYRVDQKRVFAGSR